MTTKQLIYSIRHQTKQAVPIGKAQYAIFWGSKWCRSLSASRVAKFLLSTMRDERVRVYAMPYDRESWDAPTFRALGDCVFDGTPGLIA